MVVVVAVEVDHFQQPPLIDSQRMRKFSKKRMPYIDIYKSESKLCNLDFNLAGVSVKYSLFRRLTLGKIVSE